MTLRTPVAAGYHPALDGLRGVAVLLVLVDHYVIHPPLQAWNLGATGVRIFFVLSGFLIMGNLLRDRDRLPPGRILPRFLLGRALRLLPALYIAIAAAALLGINNMRDDWWVHGLYLSNLLVHRHEDWNLAGHLWTLAVEMQFYALCFPLAVLLPRRWLAPAIGLLVAAGLIWRARIPLGASSYEELLVIGQFDAFGIGMALALLVGRGPIVHGGWAGRLDRWLAGGWTAPALCAVAMSALALQEVSAIRWIVAPLLVALATAATIRATLGRRDVPVLTDPRLVHVGVISYGLYVYHYFVGYALHAHVPAATALDDHVLLRALVWTAISFALAQASWSLVERPALRLKAALASRPAGTRPAPAGRASDGGRARG